MRLIPQKKNNNLNYNTYKDNDNNQNNNNINTSNNKVNPKSLTAVTKNMTFNYFNNYSFKCLTKKLNFTMNKGISEATYKLIYENDGEFPWPKNRTILSTDYSNSNIKIQDVLMEPLNPGCQCTFDIKFRNMNKLPEGKYYSYLDFKVNGKKYGNSILINIEILEINKKKYDSIINAVRVENSSDKKIASDKNIDIALDKTNTI